MTERRSVFYDEWRDCLHSHYLYVLETGDDVTEPTLRHVLVAAGVPSEMVEEWRLEAADRFGLDWVKMEYEQAHPSPSVEGTAPIVEELPEISEREELPAELAAEVEGRGADLAEAVMEEGLESVVEDAPKPRLSPKPVTRSQLSLFGDE